jgi:hypothetical protein
MKALLITSCAFLFSVLIISCTHSTSPGNGGVPALYGSWQWYRTSGGFGGSVTTPESCGCTAKAVFKPEGVVQFFQNDTLAGQYPFTIVADTSYSQQNYFLHAESGTYYPNQFINISGDTLVLTDNCADCFTHFYVRMR